MCLEVAFETGKRVFPAKTCDEGALSLGGSQFMFEIFKDETQETEPYAWRAQKDSLIMDRNSLPARSYYSVN